MSGSDPSVVPVCHSKEIVEPTSKVVDLLVNLHSYPQNTV